MQWHGWISKTLWWVKEALYIPNSKYYMIPLTCSSRRGKSNLWWGKKSEELEGGGGD